MLTEDELGKDLVEALRRTEPKVIIYDGHLQRLASEVRDYIHDHYRAMGIGNLYRRVDQSWENEALSPSSRRTPNDLHRSYKSNSSCESAT